MGSIRSILEMLGINQMTAEQEQAAQEKLKKTKAIIQSMTTAEKKDTSILNANIHTKDSESCKEISLVQSGNKDIFVRINLDTENGEGYKKGDILSIDMSKEIKDKLI
jgi:broad specificity polyphosphatase/5'/3'-nucleotidase SurE